MPTTINLTTDKACCGITLRNACLSIAIFYLVSFALSVIITPSYLTHSTTLIGFILEVLANVALLIGALQYNQWLVLVWLIQAILFFIGWPIAFFGVIFNYGPYRQVARFDNIFLILLEYIIGLLIFIYLARLVYSFWLQLKNSKSAPQHAVVV